MQKTCTRCGVTKVPREFYRDPMMTGGRRNQCRTCMSRNATERYRANREVKLKQQRDYDQSPERKLARKLGTAP